MKKQSKACNSSNSSTTTLKPFHRPILVQASLTFNNLVLRMNVKYQQLNLLFAKSLFHIILRYRVPDFSAVDIYYCSYVAA